jgi:TPR repeat protein
MRRLGAVVGICLGMAALAGGGRAAEVDAGVAAYARGDYATALEDWLPLAERGDPVAQLHVGKMLRDRQGVRWRDFEGAAAWFRRAAVGGNAEAQYALGRLHYEGFLVPRDTAEMRTMLRAAAWQGHARARLTLGVIYEYGLDDIGRDFTAALMWYELAARRGVPELDDKIARLRSRVSGKMTQAQIAEALRRAEAWQPAPE